MPCSPAATGTELLKSRYTPGEQAEVMVLLMKGNQAHVQAKRPVK